MKWFVYILKCTDNSLYTGIAIDPKKRFEQHVSGRGGRYTRTHRPVKIVYLEKLSNRSKALKREARIKKMTRQKKTALIKSSKKPFQHRQCLVV